MCTFHASFQAQKVLQNWCSACVTLSFLSSRSAHANLLSTWPVKVPSILYARFPIVIQAAVAALCHAVLAVASVLFTYSVIRMSPEHSRLFRLKPQTFARDCYEHFLIPCFAIHRYSLPSLRMASLPAYSALHFCLETLDH